jgi:hypothetical protein
VCGFAVTHHLTQIAEDCRLAQKEFETLRSRSLLSDADKARCKALGILMKEAAAWLEAHGESQTKEMVESR